MSRDSSLPPGQTESADFPRFGLAGFANRFPRQTEKIELEITGDVDAPFSIGTEFAELPRSEQTSDFHCVTTWSKRQLRWSGVRFRDFHDAIGVRAAPQLDVTLVIFRSQDGYSQHLLLEDLLADDVLLADQLDGEPLGIEHGAPLRLVAPAHYGFKNVKHVCGIGYWRDLRAYRFPGPKFMDHARARVALEERANGLSPRTARWIYKLLVPPTRWLFRRQLEKHLRRR